MNFWIGKRHQVWSRPIVWRHFCRECGEGVAFHFERPRFGRFPFAEGAAIANVLEWDFAIGWVIVRKWKRDKPDPKAPHRADG